MPDPDRVREALDREHYATVEDVEAVHAAARSWLEGTEIRWCTVHDASATPSRHCWRAYGWEIQDGVCRIVSRRLVGGE